MIVCIISHYLCIVFPTKQYGKARQRLVAILRYLSYSSLAKLAISLWFYKFFGCLFSVKTKWHRN